MMPVTRLISSPLNFKARSRAAAAKTKTPIVIEALVPKTGATLFFDTMAIPKDAKNVENAHLFINYILRPEVHASLTNKVFYANPNAASLLLMMTGRLRSKARWRIGCRLTARRAPKDGAAPG